MQTDLKRRFIISGGGTGGHIYPAIAIANELKSRFADAEFLFVGAKDRMEMEKVPQNGYDIEGLWISGLQRSLTLKNLLFPLKVMSSIRASKRILRRFQPDIAIGTGGFASGPLLKAAASKKIPCLIQEQNSYAGITNKWLARDVSKICVAYEGMEKFFPSEKIRITGNPVRQDLVAINMDSNEAKLKFQLTPNKKTLLVLGGSLGARAINELTKNSLSIFNQNNVQVIWQCGSYYQNVYKPLEDENVRVFPFLNDMDVAYAAADIIVSRAGALSVSELCLVGKPVIFIPSPNVAEDHQTHNAKAIASKDAAILIKESEAGEMFAREFKKLLESEQTQQRLAENIKKLALPNATKEIVDEIELLINSKN